MRDRHSLMLTACAHRRAASLRLSLVIFSITHSELCSLVGERRTVDSEPDNSTPQGVWTLCPAEKNWCAVWNRGRGGVEWAGGEMVLQESRNWGDWREEAHQYLVMAVLESYFYRNAEITQDKFTSLILNSHWETTGGKFTWLRENRKNHRVINVSGAFTVCCVSGELHRA